MGGRGHRFCRGRRVPLLRAADRVLVRPPAETVEGESTPRYCQHWLLSLCSDARLAHAQGMPQNLTI